MDEITIKGLHQSQKDLLDIMWKIDTFENFQIWCATLDPETKKQVSVLRELLVSYCIDEEASVSDLSEAKAALESIMKRG